MKYLENKKTLYIFAEMRGHSILKDIFTDHIEQEPNESDLYTTREEIQDAELNDPNETGRINWDKFDELVKNTKNTIAVKVRRFKTVIEAYDRTNGQLINQYDSYKEAAMDWYTTPELIASYCRKKVPYLKRNVLFKTRKIRISAKDNNERQGT